MVRFDRASVRLMVEEYGEEMVAFAKAGGNTHQKELDKKDELDALTAEWPEDERVASQPANMWI